MFNTCLACCCCGDYVVDAGFVVVAVVVRH